MTIVSRVFGNIKRGGMRRTALGLLAVPLVMQSCEPACTPVEPAPPRSIEQRSHRDERPGAPDHRLPRGRHAGRQGRAGHRQHPRRRADRHRGHRATSATSPTIPEGPRRVGDREHQPGRRRRSTPTERQRRRPQPQLRPRLWQPNDCSVDPALLRRHGGPRASRSRRPSPPSSLEDQAEDDGVVPRPAARRSTGPSSWGWRTRPCSAPTRRRSGTPCDRELLADRLLRRQRHRSAATPTSRARRRSSSSCRPASPAR